MDEVELVNRNQVKDYNEIIKTDFKHSCTLLVLNPRNSSPSTKVRKIVLLKHFYD